MKPKPNRTFVYLALIMVFLLVIGLVVVGMLVASNRTLSEFDLPQDCMCALNPTVVAYAIQTITAKAKLTLTPFTDDRSPTIAANNPCPFFYPTPPYNPELFAQRCK